MKNFSLSVILFFSVVQSGDAQIFSPVKWIYTSEKINNAETRLLIKATIEKGWHIYSRHIQDGGPVPTSITFQPAKGYELIGDLQESPQPVAAFDKSFNMPISWHENEVVFTQLVRVRESAIKIHASLEFMACNDTRCLPPEEATFVIPIDQAQSANIIAPSSVTSNKSLDQPAASISDHSASAHAIIEKPISSSLWAIYLAGFLGGLAAFLMPCIYPMIPLTVSFFTKNAGSHANGIQNAIIYGLSIILIYVAIGLVVTLIFGASALNEAASSVTFNLLFFALLILFAISFLGGFELSLPANLTNLIDAKSNQSGFIGLFFMAFTLVLVSFSCTGPIIGTLLVDAVSKGAYLGPAVGMLGFSSALAAPFTLFAIFPSAFKKMPQSGGWLNTIKVSLGFLELALAFKFLSNVDLAYHWEIFNRDVFLILWISIFAAFGLYLFGKIRLQHNPECTVLSLPRLFLAMLVFGFTIYMIPGLWGAPLKAISAWLPPLSTQDFNLNANYQSPTVTKKKYTNLFHAPHGLEAYYDYEEGLAYAKQVKKPILLDFTGWTCTNCRKMEASVWADSEILRRMKEDFVLISLYVDDKTLLPEDEQYVSPFLAKKIQTIGQKWSDLQAARFGTNSQPYYIIINHHGEMLVPAQAFDLDVDHYIQFLDKGKSVFQHKN